MINPTPNVSSKYGSPMGRRSFPHLATEAGKLYLQRIPINSGGYDRGGAYWGIGAPLYYVADQDGNCQYFRAANRNAAKVKVTAEWPEARFYN